MTAEDDRRHETWITSDRVLPRRFVRPVLRFTHVEASGGIVLLGAAVVALVWANASFGDTYERFWGTNLSLEIGSFRLEESLKDVVNDALMAIFFFVVGLEIKRELAVGELNDPRRAALPAVAALGGVILPALIYLAITAGAGPEASRGWGIPMATDIAFSIGVLALLGARVSVGAKLFLLALAIADDIVAITVIAVFYTTDLSLGWLLLGGLGLVAVGIASRAGVRSIGFFVVLGVATWFFVFESGVHATLAGVALGFLTPARPWYSDKVYRRRSRAILDQYDVDSVLPGRRERIDHHALALSNIARESVAPLDRFERVLHPWSSFVIVPLFALANAGVRFTDIDVAAEATSGVAVGVATGLVVGKVVGITLATWIAVRLGIGELPDRTRWTHIIGLAALAGIGFTVSLFVTELAFTVPELVDRAKIGIFIGSSTAGVIGWLLLRSGKAPEDTEDVSQAS